MNIGCHIRLTSAGVFGYVDDITLVATSFSSLNQMIKICEQFAETHSIILIIDKHSYNVLI